MIRIEKSLRRLIILFLLTIVLTLVLGFETNTLGEIIEDRNSNDFAVMVKENGLWIVDLVNRGDEVIVDKGGLFKKPRISPDGQNVAYTKDGGLYISSIDLTKGEKEIIKIAEKVVSYGWVNNSELAYSTDKGGLNGFNIKLKKSSIYVKSSDYYEGIVGDGKGTVYGEKYRYYIKDGEQYGEAKGVISYHLGQGEEKLIIPSKPISEDGEDLGFLPEVAGISKNGAYVYIWCKVNAASMNADGVGFGAYEVKNNRFISFDKEKIFALAYKDNLAINPVDGRFPVLNNGGVRNMNYNKTLGVVDVITGIFTHILPQSMTGGGVPYGIAIKGMVTMTLNFSPDGKKVVFSAAEAVVDMHQWARIPHNIYSIDIETKKVEKITKDRTFDFAPTYISKGKGIVFARKDQGDYISLWKVQNGKEEIVAKDIKLSEYSWYYGHYNLESSLDIYISENALQR